MGNDYKQPSGKVNSELLGGLEHIFGSQTREEVLRFLLLNDRPFFLREIARSLNQHLNAVRREMMRFSKMGLVKEELGPGRKKFYCVQQNHVLYPELKALVIKSHLVIRSRLIDHLIKIGNPSCVILTGFFTGSSCPTDILIIGTVPHKELEAVVRTFEEGLGREINYTVLTVSELRYRVRLGDHFIQQAIHEPHFILVNRLSPEDQMLCGMTRPLL